VLAQGVLQTYFRCRWVRRWVCSTLLSAMKVGAGCAGRSKPLVASSDFAGGRWLGATLLSMRASGSFLGKITDEGVGAK
jgi:hypothetical protein